MQEAILSSCSLCNERKISGLWLLSSGVFTSFGIRLAIRAIHVEPSVLAFSMATQINYAKQDELYIQRPFANRKNYFVDSIKSHASLLRMKMERLAQKRYSLIIVVINLHGFLSSVEHKRLYFEECGSNSCKKILSGDQKWLRFCRVNDDVFRRTIPLNPNVPFCCDECSVPTSLINICRRWNEDES